ncbi:PREDICTED: protein boule-like isoform X2 [Branchiostoma belcheri]|uniref:Protein boule-like n=1 Tax=Branchiostoma belcheri TaxID=7741 RepID=A0A6P4ZLU3_BRABE|nr:PREDICTED: protein boule-like isoform X2 [Branchiostoma belcheri]
MPAATSDMPVGPVQCSEEVPVTSEEVPVTSDGNNNVVDDLVNCLNTLNISEPLPQYVQYVYFPIYQTDSVQGTVGSPIPASTPSTEVTSPTTGPNTYKYKIPSGTKIDGRIFVGGVTAGTSEQELKGYFGAYGSVKDVKIIFDKQGLTKGYAFVTFTSNEEATKLIKQADAGQLFLFKEKKLNIGPAIKKRPNYPPSPADFVVPGAGMMYTGVNTYPYTYPNGVTYFTPEGVPQTPPFPGHQALLAMPYVQPQPQHYAAAYNTASTGQQWGGQQWRWAGQNPAVTQAAPTYGSPPAYGVEYAYPSPPYPADMGGMMEATPAEVAPMMPAFDPAMQANVTYSVQTPVPAVDYTRTAGMVSWSQGRHVGTGNL